MKYHNDSIAVSASITLSATAQLTDNFSIIQNII